MATQSLKASQKKRKQAAAVATRRFETHDELLADMNKFRQETLATPGAAKQFLIDAGLVTKAGKPKQLIRD